MLLNRDPKFYQFPVRRTNKTTRSGRLSPTHVGIDYLETSKACRPTSIYYIWIADTCYRVDEATVLIT